MASPLPAVVVSVSAIPRDRDELCLLVSAGVRANVGSILAATSDVDSQWYPFPSNTSIHSSIPSLPQRSPPTVGAHCGCRRRVLLYVCSGFRVESDSWYVPSVVHPRLRTDPSCRLATELVPHFVHRRRSGASGPTG